MKKILTLAFVLGFALAAPAASAAEPSVTMSPDRDSYFVDERFSVNLVLETPHTPVRVRYYTVSSKGKATEMEGSKAFGGTYLEGMSAGLSVGAWVNLKPGRYRYRFVLDDGREFESHEFTVARRIRAPKLQIGSFGLTFGAAPGAPYADHDFRLGVEVGAAVDLSGVRYELDLRCRPALTLGNKEGSFACGKKWQQYSEAWGTYYGEGWLMDAEDFPKPVKVEARLRLYDGGSGRLLDTEKKQVTVSANG